MMKKKLLTGITCLLLIFCMIFPVSAEAGAVVDNASLFSISESLQLQAKAAKLKETYQMDVVILTINDLEGKTPQDYADDYYDNNGYGCGPDNSGVLFLIAMDTRDWYMSTCGDAIYALTDYGIEQVFSEMATYLSNDQYFAAFDVYLDTLPTYFEAFQNGSPIDGYVGSYDGPGSYSPGDAEEHVYYEGNSSLGFVPKLLISLAIGAVVALIVILIMRGTMNTAKHQRSAGNYLVNGSFHLNIHRDLFLYSNVTKTRRQSSSSSGGGGSSVHRSSGGVRHGGGGGKF